MPAVHLESGLHLPAGRVRAAGPSLLAGAAVSAMLFLLLCIAVWNGALPLPVDARVDDLLSPHRGPALLASFAALTVLGKGKVAVLAGVLASAWLAWRRRTGLVAAFWLMFACAGISTWLAKVLVARARPDFIEGFAASSPAFPSSHAVAALAAYGFLAWALARDARAATRWLASAGTALLVLLVAGSRVVLGVHHVTDVIGGLLLAGAWALAGVHAARLRLPAR